MFMKKTTKWNNHNNENHSDNVVDTNIKNNNNNDNRANVFIHKVHGWVVNHSLGYIFGRQIDRGRQLIRHSTSRTAPTYQQKLTMTLEGSSFLNFQLAVLQDRFCPECSSK